MTQQRLFYGLIRFFYFGMAGAIMIGICSLVLRDFSEHAYERAIYLCGGVGAVFGIVTAIRPPGLTERP